MTDAQKTKVPEIHLVGTSRLRRKLAHCRKFVASLRRIPTLDEEQAELCREIEENAQAIEAELSRRAHHPIARAAS